MEQKEKFLEAMNVDMETLKAFLYYLGYNSMGNEDSLIATFNQNTTNIFSGYVDVKKKIKNNRLLLEFDYDGNEYSAEWEPIGGYGVCSIGERAYCNPGYLLFPTLNENRYFLLYFEVYLLGY